MTPASISGATPPAPTTPEIPAAPATRSKTDHGGFGTVLFGGFLIHSATDEDCPVVAVVEVPALGPLGLVLLTLVLACASVRRLRA